MKKFSSARRQAIKAIGAALAASTLPMPFINLRAQEHNFSGKTLRLLTWSDDTGAAALRNIAATFTAKTGAKVIADRADGTSGMVAKVKAAGDRPTYDVITLAGVGASGLGDAGLLVKPDLDKLPNLKDVAPQYRTGANGFGVGYLLWSDGLIYNTSTVKTRPVVVRSALGSEVRRPPVPAAARMGRSGRSRDHRRENVRRLAAEHRPGLQEAGAVERPRDDARRESEPGGRSVPHRFARYRRHLFAGVLSRTRSASPSTRWA